MLSSKYLFHLCLSVTLITICLFLKMPPVRQSRHLAQQEVDVDDTSYACFLCLIMVDVTMHAAKLTPCCSRRIHRISYQHHVNSHNCCGNCRTPFAVYLIENNSVNKPLEIWKPCWNQALLTTELLK